MPHVNIAVSTYGILLEKPRRLAKKGIVAAIPI